MFNKIKVANDNAITKVVEFLDDFKEGFPPPQSTDYVYPATENSNWTEGFYAGMVMLSYEHTKDQRLLKRINEHLASFKNRIDNKIKVEHHDLGFLYSLSCVAAYKVIGSEEAKQTAIKAADTLSLRWKDKGNFIQAWGALDDPNAHRLIIDCMMNLSLLYWASEVTGDTKYADMAKKHSDTCLSVIMRPDGTTFHTYYFDTQTGEPLKGVTHQGHSDDSCWARGQAWGIYGTALGYKFTKDESIIPKYKKMADYFIDNLGADGVPYWDLCFTEGDEPRDTSAAAIAVCGMLEMAKYIDDTRYIDAADSMLEALIDNYTTRDMPKCNGLLTDGMYGRPFGDKPECNIWGDYFYMEALMRKMNPEWKMYW